MGKTMTVKQVWRCKTCGNEYKSPILIGEAICSQPHARGKRQMELIEGEMPKERRKK